MDASKKRYTLTLTMLKCRCAEGLRQVRCCVNTYLILTLTPNLTPIRHVTQCDPVDSPFYSFVFVHLLQRSHTVK